MRLLLCCGIDDIARFISLRPNFDVCYGIDGDGDRIGYLKSIFPFDPRVHLIHGIPAGGKGTNGEEAPLIDLSDFFAREGVEAIDTLIMSLDGRDMEVLDRIAPLLSEGKVRSIECQVAAGKIPPGRDQAGDAWTDGFDYLGPLHEVPPGKGPTVAVGWGRKDGTSLRPGPEAAPPPARGYTFNVIYVELPDSSAHTVKRGNLSVTVSSSPVPDCDLYLYANAYNFSGRQKGYNVLLLGEPIVVQPGQYNETVWGHFDHIFTLYDRFVQTDGRFTKVLLYRTGWGASDTDITERMAERERLYPLKGRLDAIVMINGNKSSPIPGELYSKRVETALWFFYNSDIPFHVYGEPPFFLPNYKGSLPKGVRLATTARYKYYLCFENMDHPEFALGYVEKILDCLETRTIPIYLGSANIEKYVPRECFIDFRDFRDLKALDAYLHAMTDAEYRGYIEAMDRFVIRGGLRPYSWYTFYDQLARFYASREGMDVDALLGDNTSWKREPAPMASRNEGQSTYWSFLDLASTAPQFIPIEEIRARSERDLFENVKRATSLATAGNYEGALKEMAGTIYTGDPGLHFFCAQLLHIAGMEEAELIQLDIVLTLNPNHSLAHNQLGTLFYGRNEYEKAEGEFRKSYDLDNSNLLPLKNLAFLLLRTGRKSEAVPLMKKVEDSFPEVKDWSV